MNPKLFRFINFIKDLVSIILTLCVAFMSLKLIYGGIYREMIYSCIAIIPMILLGEIGLSYRYGQNQLKNTPDIYVNTEETIKYRFLYDKEKIKGSLVSYYYVCWKRLSYIIDVFEIIPLAFYLVTYLFFKEYILIPIIILTIYSIAANIIWFTLPKRFPKIASKNYPHYKNMVYKDIFKD